MDPVTPAPGPAPLAADPEQMVADYVAAFNAGDVARCLDFYAEDASILFMAATYRGRAAIEQWLRERFAMGAQVVRLNGVEANGDSLAVHAAVTSRKLAAWRLATINGRATIRLDADRRMAECRLAWDGFRPGIRKPNPA